MSVAVEDSELHSDRTLDDDDDNENADEWSTTAASQRPTTRCTDSQSRQSPSPAVERERQHSAADDTADDSELKDDDWTYPDDNSPSNGTCPQQRERRDSGVGSSLTRASRSLSPTHLMMYSGSTFRL